MGDPPDVVSATELERLRAGLRIMALRALGDRDAAEEVAQESLARVVVAVRAGRVEPSRLGAVAWGIARHVIADTIRARRRAAGPLESAGAEPQATAPDALSALVSAEEAGRVRAAIGRLAPADRDILRLSFFDGLTPADLAARLGQPAERVRKRKSRALERLREAFFGRARAGTGAVAPAPAGHESSAAPTYAQARPVASAPDRPDLSPDTP